MDGELQLTAALPVTRRRQRAPHPSTEEALARRKIMDDHIDKAVSGLPPLPESLEEFWTTIPTSDGWESRCKAVQPKSHPQSMGPSTSTKRRPLIVYFYGGGYTNGNPGMVTRPAREWAELHNATVICASYRLAPEWRWPMFMTDGWDVVSWLSKNAENDQRFAGVKLDDGFVIGGASAGGGVAAVVGGISALLDSGTTDMGVDRLTKPITGIFVSIAVLLKEEIVPAQYKNMFTSREEHRNADGVDTAAVEGIMECIRCHDFTSPWFSPINAIPQLRRSQPAETSAPHLPHPRTYIQSCALDPLRDDTVIYEKMLSDVPGMNGEVKLDLFPDDAHAALTALPYPTKSQNPTIADATMEGMKWLLRWE